MKGLTFSGSKHWHAPEMISLAQTGPQEAGSGVQIHPPSALLSKAGDELEKEMGSLGAFEALVTLIVFIGFIHWGIFSTWNSAWHRVGAQQIFTEWKKDSIFVSSALLKVLVT